MGSTTSICLHHPRTGRRNNAAASYWTTMNDERMPMPAIRLELTILVALGKKALDIDVPEDRERFLENQGIKTNAIGFIVS
ncbi:hypothetical protein AYI70_g2791 [Smittium culicis]|uniref:Uncharacterized protein n=1 Tax=Smittium culicis TaxID=133412 RepID=A0A1R1Y6U7_9FUNG|nr:hypothetical protein AYI70_g2791 [Smittium culicis]